MNALDATNESQMHARIGKNLKASEVLIVAFDLQPQLSPDRNKLTKALNRTRIIQSAIGRSAPKSRKMTHIMDRQPTASHSDRPPVVRDPHDRRDDPKTRLNLIRLRSHRAIARKIDADPSLLDIPLRNLDRWRALRGEDHPACAEWRGLLAQPWESVRALLVSDTEESARLRQSSPFTGILSAWERRRIHETT